MVLPTTLAISAATPPDLADLREMLTEYRAWIAVAYAEAARGPRPTPLDTVLRRLAREIEGLPGEYQPPDGVLLIARIGERPAGMVALRRFDEGRGEMKRLYVRATARGAGVGRQLAEHAIAEARVRRCRELLLDTLPAMASAQALYDALGFREIPPYYEAPLPGTRYLSLHLS